MDQTANFAALQSTISAALVSTTRTVTSIAAEDLGFHRSLDRGVAVALDRQNARLLSLAERLLGNAAVGSEVVGPQLRDADAVEANWKGVVDVVDSLLERADTSLDEFTGVVKRLSPGMEQSPTPKPRPGRSMNAFRTQDIVKPQTLFEQVPRNNDTHAFKPLLTSKPHAIIPLEKSLRTFTDEDGTQQHQHPYQTEIERYSYPASVYTKADPIPYHPFEETTATFVDTPEALAEMLAELKTAKEIAIDLEHHDMRSYIGIVSLMQISTRNKDWIVDTLKPWRRRLECLNEVFADPNILKVLHGAYMDIVWLQRDLGLYIVGLFDTHHASRALGYPGGSLAFLLQKFINFSAQKQYQTADWRIRPLPTEMFEYARSDTHFLLYIYDNMRNELIDKSDFSKPEEYRIRRILEKSKETALQRYETPIYDELRGTGAGGWYKQLYKTPAMFNKEQFSVFRAVHQWRDTVARQEDESVHYVMANHAVFSIARSMPADKATLFSVAQPISQTVRLRADELVAVIAKARAAGADGPDMTGVFTDMEGVQRQAVTQVAPPPPTTTPLSTTAPTRPSIFDVLPVRSLVSKFWGRSFGSSVWEASQPATAQSDVQLAVPLPPLTAEIFADPTDAVAVEQSRTTAIPGTRAEHAYMRGQDRPQENHDDDVFIIKQLGGKKRKRTETAVEDLSASTAQPAAEAEELPLPDEDAATAELRAQEKARRKAERKAAKKLKKQHDALNGIISSAGPGNEAGVPSNGVEEEAFDYANAPSVLHAARDAEGRKSRKEKGGFNPYAKAMDAPKGLPRVQKERAGRSATFKS